MSTIDTNEKKSYFKKFHCELLTAKEENLQIINDFTATDAGKVLENYLKDKAWEADSEGETRVYLVKDENDAVALFFSIKCGLLYKSYQYDELDEDKKEFVDMVINAIQDKNQELLTDYYSSNMYTDTEMTELFQIAHKRVELKAEEQVIQDGQNTLKVEECFSAIEIQHFCRNSLYKPDIDIDVPLGFGIFWEVIVPFVSAIRNKIGCKYLYLFAADHSSEKEVRKLVQYYKNDLKFCEIEGMMIIKPWYDKDCWGLIQEVGQLEDNRNAVWEEFSDVTDGVM